MSPPRSRARSSPRMRHSSETNMPLCGLLVSPSKRAMIARVSRSRPARASVSTHDPQPVARKTIQFRASNRTRAPSAAVRRRSGRRPSPASHPAERSNRRVVRQIVSGYAAECRLRNLMREQNRGRVNFYYWRSVG
jgi:hypothetical protein